MRAHKRWAIYLFGDIYCYTDLYRVLHLKQYVVLLFQGRK